MIATTATTARPARRRIPGQSTAFRAAVADEVQADAQLYALVILCLWNGHREMIECGSLAAMRRHERGFRQFPRDYKAEVRRIETAKLAAV
jgi:hypothetical protein